MTEAVVRPAPGPPRPYSFPAFTRSELPSGLSLLVAPVRRLPICALSIVVDAGAELDPAGEEGRALLTARALAEGTAEFPGIAFTEKLEGIGAALEAGADWDGTHLSLSVLAERLPEALELLAAVVRTPAFPDEEVARLREERLAEIAQIRSEPRGLASEIFSRVVYTADSRYSQPLGGDERSVQKLLRDSVVAHHAAFYSPRRTTVIVTGDVSADEARLLVERTFRDWTGGAAAAAPRHGREREEPSRLTIVNRDGAPQSELRVGHASVPRAHPDYFPLVLLNAVLGGLFSSRINLNLREEHAYTYGAHSGFDWRRGSGPFLIHTAVESGVTGGAITEILREIGRIREAPVTESELSLAVDYLSGVFPVRFETSMAIAAALAQMVTYDLPPDYYDSYRSSIAAVTADDILRAARTHLDPERIVVVALGEAASIRPQMEELNIGAVRELSPDDEPAVAAPAVA